jgi:phytoene dehydrogenase-like protein
VGLVLGAAAHAVGWPIPRSGAQSITDALLSQLASLGGQLHTSSRIQSLDDLPTDALLLCDITPRQLLALSGKRFSPSYRHTLSRYKYGPGAFKIDYALSAPLPWTAKECSRAGTVHLGGTLEEIAESEEAVQKGRQAERPFVLLAQPTLFDSTRAPSGKHIAWAYCHVPNGSNIDVAERIDAQIERFAPGFRDCILARNVLSPSALQEMDANLVGGDINGGAMTMRQTLLRPGWRYYATSDRNVYLCSSSTPPGGGVHGMCGYQAATLALARSG